MTGLAWECLEIFSDKQDELVVEKEVWAAQATAAFNLTRKKQNKMDGVMMNITYCYIVLSCFYVVFIG